MMDAADLRLALRRIAITLNRGDRTHPRGGPNHWLSLSVRDHTVKGLAHAERAMLHVASQDDELAHAATRLLLALERRERDAASKLGLKQQVERLRAG